MDSSSPFLTNVGSGIAANLVFVACYLISIGLKKKCKHSECESGCFKCKSDIQITERAEKIDGETGPSLV
jgi:hypothetical protein